MGLLNPEIFVENVEPNYLKEKCIDKQVGGVVRTKDQINKEISELEVLAQKIEKAFPGSINQKAS